MFEFLKRKKSNPKAGLKAILGSYKLPSFPAVAAEVLRKLRDRNTSVKSVAEVLSRDPGLSVQVLKMANAAAFMPARQIVDLNHAVSFIGLAHVEALVMCLALQDNIPKPTNGGLDPRFFWLVSARRGMAAQALAESICPALQSGCFTAGFLQDMAVPFLANCRPVEYRKILKQEDAGEGSLPEMERRVFGADHAEIATWLCHEWKLPEALASAIGGHHAPEDPLYVCPPPVHLVSFLRYHPEKNGESDLIREAREKYNVSLEVLTKVLESSAKQAEDFASLIRA